MTVTITLTPEAESFLREESARTGLSLEEVAAQAMAAASARERASAGSRFATAPVLSVEESALLEKINDGFPAEFWRRYRELIARRDTGALTEGERGELIDLADQVEEKNLRRAEHLIALAALRGVSLPDLIAQLGLRPIPVNP